MKFRLKAFATHLLCSIMALTLILGALYAGWYHWPGWYLADVTHVIVVMVAVDVVVGPLLTLVIANAGKPRRELRRDIAIIVAVQLVALGYGANALWTGRPLYYAFSVNCLQMVQAYDIDAPSARAARTGRLELAPRWYSRPRWIWVPFPKDPAVAERIFQSLMQGGADIIGLPQYYRPWAEGAPELRMQLQRVADIRFFSARQKVLLAARMRAAKLDPEARNGIALTGRGSTLLAVMDPKSLRLLALLEAG